VTLIGRRAHVEAFERDGLALDSMAFQERIPVAASTDIAAAHDAELVLFAVKTTDTESAARTLAAHVGQDAAVISLQNGVDNAERIHQASGLHAIPAVVYVAAAMTGPGRVKHSGRGDLIIGALPAMTRPPSADLLRSIAGAFERAGVPCTVSDRIQQDLWTKFVANVACNAVSALGRSTYGRATQDPHVRAVMVKAISESLRVAAADGVDLPVESLTDATLVFLEKFSHVYSSTAQDIARGKRTEIDSLNGYVVRRGTALGIPTPVNQTLHAMVRLLEEAPG
jgi:2-dehydropantoate 2-reductase